MKNATGPGRSDGALLRAGIVLHRRLGSCHLPVNQLTRPVFSALYRLHVLIREALIWTARFFWYEPLFRSQCRSVGRGFRMEALPYVVGSGRIVVGSSVRISGKPTIAFSRHGGVASPLLEIGDDTFVGHGCAFSVAQSIIIGRHCLLAGSVQVHDHDGHPTDAAQRRRGEPDPVEKVMPVSIGDDVWVGNGAVILKGVTIGDRSIVGARAVVTKDVPPDSIVAGNPARAVRPRSAPTPR